jgi:fumarate hydratase subunit beta
LIVKPEMTHQITEIHTPLTADVCRRLHAGDLVALSGEVFTGRDVAHRRLFEAAHRCEVLPVNLDGAVMFYAAPTPTPPGRVIGSVGPTTSGRMDAYTPKLLEMGLRGMIGKGGRTPEVRDAIRKHGAVYFGAMGGVAAHLAQWVREAGVIAYEDLGTEAMMRLVVERFPLVVLIDAEGRDFYEERMSRRGS